MNLPSSAPRMKTAIRGVSSAFTLIELLIVVAIIAILAAIAVPNFLEAQVRAKVSRAKADFRSIATALESYCVDYNAYPWNDLYPPGVSAPDNAYNPLSFRARFLTTPVAYMATVDFTDPFISQGAEGGYGNIARTQYNYRNYQFFPEGSNPSWAYLKGEPIWALNSIGPDRVKQRGLLIEYTTRGTPHPKNGPTILYDPTNGTVSEGDIPWTGGGTKYPNE
jgi:prepilin-type N-terminal cleavage/methylation domain-containing protein